MARSQGFATPSRGVGPVDPARDAGVDEGRDAARDDAAREDATGAEDDGSGGSAGSLGSPSPAELEARTCDVRASNK